jgi:polynucleotide 5'-hydroxyl-kinase GRC3/NOL9
VIVVEDESEEIEGDGGGDNDGSTASQSGEELNVAPATEGYPPPWKGAPLSPNGRSLELNGNMHDSSDEDTDADPEAPLVAPYPQLVKEERLAILSTFQPVLDHSVFHLSTAETQLLSLPGTDDGASTTLLVLSPADTVCLLGTYTLTVSHGSVDILGVRLDASRTSHRIFAPRCSPLPVLSHRSSDGAASESMRLQQLPNRVRSNLPPEYAVVVLQDLRSGVEGLGRVCQTFDSVFGRTQKSLGGSSTVLDLAGASMVRRINDFCARGLTSRIHSSATPNAIRSLSFFRHLGRRHCLLLHHVTGKKLLIRTP